MRFALFVISWRLMGEHGPACEEAHGPKNYEASACAAGPARIVSPLMTLSFARSTWIKAAEQTPDWYEFIKRDGQLVVVTSHLAEYPSRNSVVLISVTGRTGYLRRSPGRIYKLPDIDPVAFASLRRCGSIIARELRDPQWSYTHLVSAASRDDDPDIDRTAGRTVAIVRRWFLGWVGKHRP